MSKVISKDGTPIAYERTGQGPALILVTGAVVDRSDAASLATSLAPHFSVIAYDRRGRGESGDTPPYAVEREVEDIAALIQAAGGSAYVFGHSSGAILSLEAASLLGASIPKLAVYEPPFILDESRAPLPGDYVTHLNELVSSGRRGEAAAYYLEEAMGVPSEQVTSMRQGPFWPKLEAAAHTLAYDGAIAADSMQGKPLERGKWASVTIPTLVMDGGKSPAFMQHAALALTEALSHAQHRRFPDQDHGIADEVLVPALVDFFKG